MKSLLKKWSICLPIAVLFFNNIAWAQSTRSLTQISGDLYRFQNNFHYSVVLVTDEGVIVTDPINKEAAEWLKAEIANRFKQPIKYLIYSHDHVDHIAGGEVFDSLTVIAHNNAKSDIIAEQRPTAIPTLTFSDALTIELGGNVVELTYVGRSHSDNMVVMNFPSERVLFAVDFIPIKSVAWKTLSDAYIPDWIEAIKKVESMDFDTLMPGHGKPGTKADVIAFREYMEDLYAAVLAGVREGKTLKALKQSIELPKYATWFNYDKQFSLNIEGMFNQITLHRLGN